MPITYPQVYHPQQYQRPLGGVYNLASMYLAGKTAAAQADIARGRNAVNMANREDLVLIAGKGHEDYQLVGNEKRRFDDRIEAAAAASENSH